MKRKHYLSAKGRALVSVICVITVALLIVIGSLLRKFLTIADSDVISIVISALEGVGLVVSLFIAVRQLGDSKEIARAQFISDLNKSFVENEDYAKLYNALLNCYD